MRTFVVITLLVVCSVNAHSQQQSSQTRAREIAASFNKHKSAVKEKNGVRMEKYKDVRSETVVKQNPTEYSGIYEVSELGFRMSLQVTADGNVQGNGYESSRTFKLENARIAGALLTGRKVFEDGAAEDFEGVFMTRTERNSPSDSGVTTFGFGVILRTPFEHGGITYERLFLQRTQ